MKKIYQLITIMVIFYLSFFSISVQAITVDSNMLKELNPIHTPQGKVLGVSNIADFQIASTADIQKRVVQIKLKGLDLTGGLRSIGSGSGVWISNNLILTAAHVVTLEDDFGQLPSILKISLVNEDGTLKEIGNGRVIARHLKMDLAVVHVELESNSDGTLADLNNHQTANLTSSYVQGQEITISGFPGIGGDTISSTQGNISGETTEQNIKLLKTDATIGFGSSGSAVFNSNNQIVGLVTQAASDLTSGQIGYMVSAESIMPWLERVTGNSIPDYDKQLKEQLDWQDAWKTRNLGDRAPVNNLGGATYFLDYPSFPKVSVQTSNRNWLADAVNIDALKIANTIDTDSYVEITLYESILNLDIETIKDLNLALDPGLTFTDATINGREALRFILYGQVSYAIPFRNYAIYIRYETSNETLTAEAESIINSVAIDENFQTPPANTINSYTNNNFNFSITSDTNWIMTTTDDRAAPVVLAKQSNLGNVMGVTLHKLDEAEKQYTNEDWDHHYEMALSSVVGDDYESWANYDLGIGKPAIKIETTVELFSDEPNYLLNYLIPQNGVMMLIVYTTNNEEHFESNKMEVENIVKSLDITNFGLSTADEEEALVDYIDYGLTNQLEGYILLQVERNGEAWYVDSNNSKKYYLKDGDVAYEALREFGLGISNINLDKIPVGIENRFEDVDSDNDGLADKLEEALGTNMNNCDSDNDGFDDGTEVKGGYNPLGGGKKVFDNSLSESMKGRILLQVESRGEAWYINPEDNKRYYMKDGEAAYQIMRFLSLGVTNNNLRKIEVGRL